MINNRIKGVGSVAKLDAHFKVDYTNALANDKAIFKGNKYRITILSERLIRFEYDVNGRFLIIQRNLPASVTLMYLSFK